MCGSGGNPPPSSTAPASGPSSSSPPGATVPCPSPCTVTISPKPLAICGAGTTGTLTATGSPSGGGFAWSTSDAAVATVTGSGNTATVTGVAAGKAVIKATYSPAGCPPCTDTVEVKVCTCTAGRKYAYALKHEAKLIGVKATIKTRYGKLCCEDEGCNTADAYHVVYANISNNSGKTIWAQSGYGRERNPGSTTINTYRYAEMNGKTYKVNYDTGNAPTEGSTHTYQCDLNRAKGKWTFKQDGTAWQTYADKSWKNKTGTDFQYTGEIYNTEDDMPGTAADKCNFTACQYRVAGKAYQDAGLVAGDVNSDDANEWGAEWISGTEFNIWDKKPLP